MVYLSSHYKHLKNHLCASLSRVQDPDGTTLRRGVVYVTLTMGIFQGMGLFLIQSYRTHVPNGRGQGEGSASEFCKGLVARPLTSQEPYCKSLSACSYPFKIVLEKSSTALGASVGVAWLSSFSVVEFGTSTGSLRTGIRTVFSRRILYIHLSLIDYITPRAGDINDGVTTSFFLCTSVSLCELN
jgi:hypothetical protein